MSTKGFGSVSPDAEASSGPSSRPGSPDTGRRRLAHRVSMRWLIAAATAGLLVVMVVLSLHSCSGAGSGGGGVRAGHGPTTVTGGVPTGYTRDRAGAATAAVNIVQALTQAGQGRTSVAAVRSALAASHPGPGLTKSMDIASGREHDSNVLNVLPAAVTVESLHPEGAHVAVWTLAVSRDSITPGDPVSVVTLWSSTTVSLVWEHGDWKAEDLTTRSGPTPDEVVAPNSGSPLTRPLQGGYYTFYVD